MRTIESSGKSVDEAIFRGLEELGLSLDEVEISIVQNETKGVFGIGAKPAIVKLTEKEPEDIVAFDPTQYQRPAREKSDRYDRPRRERSDRYDRSERSEKPAREEGSGDSYPRREVRESRGQRENRLERERLAREKEEREAGEASGEVTGEAENTEAAEEEAEPRRDRRRPRREREHESARPKVEYNYSEEAAKDHPAAVFLSGLLRNMGVEAKVLLAEQEDGIRLRIDSPTMGILIGHRGETLDAMQYLTSLVYNRNRKDESYTRVTLDTEDYRDKREETLTRLAKRIAQQVKTTGRARTLEPMNPYERRILHSALQNNPYVTTHSEGEEPNRRVVVTPKK